MKSIQERQIPYKSLKSKKETREISRKEKFGTKIIVQSKRDFKNEF